MFADATEDILINTARAANIRQPKQKQKYRKNLRRGSSTVDLQCTNSSSEWCSVTMPLKRFFEYFMKSYVWCLLRFKT